MSGKTFLLNTAARTSDLPSLSGEWFIVAQARDLVPLSWLCLFGPADLAPCNLTFMEAVEADGMQRHVPRRLPVLNPVVSVREALVRLARARPAFDRLAVDPTAAARAWQEAMDALAGMALEYLTIDPTRALLAEDPGQAAALYAAAFSDGPQADAARRRIARLDPARSAAASANGLDGGFLGPGQHLRRSRSPEEARDIQARVATLPPAVGAPTPTPTPTPTPAPAPRPAAGAAAEDPSEDFWSDEALLAHGRQQVEVVAGGSMFTGVRRYYRISLTNRSARPIRVRRFAGFVRTDRGYVKATAVPRWFDDRTFVAWYGAPADGWIAPGQTVSHLSQSATDQEEAWAFACEDAGGESFMATLQVARSATGGRANAAGWVIDLPRDTLVPMSDLGQREIDRLVARFQAMTRETQDHLSTLDVAGIRWLDKAIDEIHASGDRSQWEVLIPMFGAFLGEVTRRMGQGRWLVWNEIACVQSGGAVFLPYQTVIRRLVEGRATDTTMLGLVIDGTSPELARPVRSEVRPSPADPEMVGALDRLRAVLAERRKTMHPLTLAGICGPAPAWMTDEDGLREAVDRQRLLLAEGTVGWAALVQANRLLFKPGTADCPAQVIYSRDALFDGRPQELRAIAQRIFQLKGARPSDPRERAIADKVTNEMDRTMGWRLPLELTDRPVFSAAIMVWRRHIPAGVLSGACFPVLSHPDTSALMIVPVEFWPTELVRLWKEGRL